MFAVVKRIGLILAVAVALSLAAAPAASAFRTPTGNIGCAIDSGGARCDIRDRVVEPAGQAALVRARLRPGPERGHAAAAAASSAPATRRC